MPSLGHVAVGMAAGRLWTSLHQRRQTEPQSYKALMRSMVAFSALSLAPDLDVIAFRLGVPYAAPWGHRGAAHSICIALVLAGLAALATRLSRAANATLAGLPQAVAVSEAVAVETPGGMSMRRIAGVCLLAAACGSGQSSQVTLKGQLQSSTAAKQADPLLLAMGWYPTFAGTAPGSPVGAVITQANIQYQGTFPVDFGFTLTGTPPAAAQFDLSTTGGKGHLAYGVLIAFRDVNGNGKFDENSAGHAEADVIAGLSVPDPSRPPPEHSYFVVWLDGQPAASDYYSAFPLQQGYNLMELHYNFGIEPVPLTTTIAIPVTDSPALNLYACQAAFQDISWFKRSCGIDPYGGTYQAQGSIFSSAGKTDVQINVNDADGVVANAALSIDGAPFVNRNSGQVYSYTTPSQLLGTHTLSFSVPNRATETMSITLPEAVSLTAPSANQSFASGSKVTISWSAAAGTAYYDIYFTADDGSGDWLFHGLSTSTTVTTPAIDYVGPARLTLKAIAPLAVGSQGSFVTPMTQATIPVTFTH